VLYYTWGWGECYVEYYGVIPRLVLQSTLFSHSVSLYAQ
jgi:hypothetical protein